METKEQNELADIVVRSVIKSVLASGEIDITNLSNEEIESKCLEHIKVLVENESVEWDVSIDHRPELIEQAKNFYNTEKYDLSIVLYAMWLEHWINCLYHKIFIREKLSYNDYKDMVRSLNMRAKTGWFLKVLGLPDLDKNQLRIFNKIIESRNSFVHYKWQPCDDTLEEHKDIELLENVDSLIEYLDAYERENIYFGHKL